MTAADGTDGVRRVEPTLVDRSDVQARAERGRRLVLVGCALFAASVVLPVMRWGVSEAHTSAGSARVLFGDGYTLRDGGFAGAALLPLALVAVVVLAVVTALPAGPAWRWPVQVAAGAVACYWPAWIAYVFVRKWEDEVSPAEGCAALVAGLGCIAVGLWVGRPRGERPVGPADGQS